jgi:predicted DCC family thiol-disulfide oxidoreductase YuxK
MSERYLLFDGGCSVCAALAREVETLSGGRLRVRSLREPEVQALLDRARPGWRWEPMLVEIEGERVRVLVGLAMRARLVQVLGPVRAWRLAQAVTCGAQMASPSRMQPFLLSFLILLTMLLFSHNAFAYSVCCKWSTNYATYRYGYLPMAFWDPTDRGASAWTSVPTTLALYQI